MGTPFKDAVDFLTELVVSLQDDVDQATSVEELEKQIEKLAKVRFRFVMKQV